MSYTNHAVLELEGEEVPCWSLKILLVAENRAFVVEKRGRRAERRKTIREGINLLNARWMKGLGRLGGVG